MAGHGQPWPAPLLLLLFCLTKILTKNSPGLAWAGLGQTLGWPRSSPGLGQGQALGWALVKPWEIGQGNWPGKSKFLVGRVVEKTVEAMGSEAPPSKILERSGRICDVHVQPRFGRVFPPFNIIKGDTRFRRMPTFSKVCACKIRQDAPKTRRMP